jgi:aminoglycoside phosphotransferase (APT) family kinase protein
MVHGDYQHFNVLWVRERLTGVVDWVSAGRGAADYDVGHAELNLAVLFGADWARRFREAYEAETGRRVHPALEAYALLAYDAGWSSFIPIQVGRRAVVDVAGMHGRVEDLITDVLQRAER